MIRPTQAGINVTALRNNVRAIRSKLVPGARIMGVVKDNCYGHDAGICIPVLRDEGINCFGAASVEDGILLRSLGVEERIVVLSPPIPGQMEKFATHGLEAMISNRRMAEQLSGESRPGATVAAHLFVDTGMGRNGARPDDVVETLRSIAAIDNLSIRGFASHFATSDETDNTFADEQLTLFDGLLRQAIGAGFTFEDVHIANSGGVLNLPTSHYTLVRPGLALYGYHPTRERQGASGLEPVMSLRSAIMNITPMPAGASISYGRRYYTSSATLIATLPIGYGDGWMRRLTNRASALIGGRRFPIVGTVCMDEIMVDLGANPDASVGDEAVLIGSDGRERIDAWDLALAAETIPYEICTNISARVPRVRVEI